MSDDLYNSLRNQMSYGTLTRGELPGDIEDYTVNLERRVYNNSPATLHLHFLPKRSTQSPEFSIKIDEVKEPAHPLILIKYSESEENKVSAKVTSKIKKKMILSVEKQEQPPEQFLDEEEEESDSDIPRGKPLCFYFEGDEEEGRNGRKRAKGEESDS